MNDWILGGIAIVGTLVLVGAGSWISSFLRGKKKPDQA
jgi:hypothetical protein